MEKREGKHNRIEELAEALRRGRQRFEQIMEEDLPDFAVDEIYAAGCAADGESFNRIGAGDNLDYMVWLLKKKGMAGKIQLIYVDPPFFSSAKYQSSVQIVGRDGKKSPVLKVGAYQDNWGNDLGAYLEMLAVRFFLMRQLLTDTGSLWVHLDWHGSHYVKMMLDEIFGEEMFINEVVWTYKSGGASKRSFARKHDTLLFYAKTKKYLFKILKEKSYNRGFKPYHFKGVEEFKDDLGWYTMVNMKDVWSIDMVGRTSSERRGYATQKPEKLLERIVEACTDPGDLCADFFAGTGTLGAVCSRKGRPWIMCDEGDVAIGSQIPRMAEAMEAADEGMPRRPFLVERPLGPYELRPRTFVQAKHLNERLSLIHCQPDLTQIREQDRAIVADHINEDPAENSLDLISFWSVDPAWSGREHVCRKMLAGREGTDIPRQIAENTGQAGEGTLHIVGYDIFGNRFTWTKE